MARNRPAQASGTPTAAQGLQSAASHGLLMTGVIILGTTTGILITAVTRYLAGMNGPPLPVVWCRDPALGHLPPLSGSTWLTAWQMNWLAAAVLIGLAAVYLAGVIAVSRQGRRPWPLWRTLCFLAGLGVAGLATMSAIAVYDMALFSAHMLGHLALVMVAPPLLVLGHPMTLALHATRNPWHGRIKRLLRSKVVALWFSPPVALASYGVIIVGTHLTVLMDHIMTKPWLGQLEHVAYLAVGYQFFALAIGDEPLRWRLSMPGKMFMLALAMAVDTFTGVILLQTTRGIAMAAEAPEGTDALAETHLGGALMWVLGDGIMALVMVVVAMLWSRQPEHRRRSRSGWLENARRSTLAGHLTEGTAEPTPDAAHMHDVDADEQTLAGYNAWLQRLDEHEV